jgi:hypothetical protein
LVCFDFGLKIDAVLGLEFVHLLAMPARSAGSTSLLTVVHRHVCANLLQRFFIRYPGIERKRLGFVCDQASSISATLLP